MVYTIKQLQIKTGGNYLTFHWRVPCAYSCFLFRYFLFHTEFFPVWCSTCLIPLCNINLQKINPLMLMKKYHSEQLRPAIEICFQSWIVYICTIIFFQNPQSSWHVYSHNIPLYLNSKSLVGWKPKNLQWSLLQSIKNNSLFLLSGYTLVVECEWGWEWGWGRVLFCPPVNVLNVCKGWIPGIVLGIIVMVFGVIKGTSSGDLLIASV